MCCKDLITTKMNLAVLLTRLEKLARRPHYDCDDRWYSCPKAEDGCCNDAKGDECDCGADEHNREIEQLITQSLKLIKEM